MLTSKAKQRARFAHLKAYILKAKPWAWLVKFCAFLRDNRRVPSAKERSDHFYSVSIQIAHIERLLVIWRKHDERAGIKQRRKVTVSMGNKDGVLGNPSNFVVIGIANYGV